MKSSEIRILVFKTNNSIKTNLTFFSGHLLGHQIQAKKILNTNKENIFSTELNKSHERTDESNPMEYQYCFFILFCIHELMHVN